MLCSFRLRLTLLVLLGLAAVAAPPAAAQEAESEPKPGLRIAVVDLNRALNDSVAGQRSKRILLADKDQMESDLKAKEEELKARRDELENSIMLTEEAKAERQTELRTMERRLRDAVQQAQRELQDKERRYTENIFNELKTVIGLVAREQGYDVVLEKAASQVILFTQFQFDDITDQVIERYNTIQDNQ